MSTTLTPERAIPLTLRDRCDRCGAQAFIRAVFVNGDLTFCGHHGRELRSELKRDALLYEDGTAWINTQTLVVRPTPGD